MDQLLLPVFSDAMLLAACKLSCSVRDEPSYVTTDMGSVESHVVAPTATKNRECEIHDIDCIEPMKDGSNNQPASVHEGALSQFLDIWSNSPLQEEGEDRGVRRRWAVASLATLCMLNKQLQPGNPKSIFCITFGFPLVGDEVVARAVRRKRWGDQLCHVVLGRDVFSRVLLAPCINVHKRLEALLPCWKRSMQSARDFLGSTDTPMEEALPEGIAEFVSTVLQRCSAVVVVKYSSTAKTSPNNALIAANCQASPSLRAAGQVLKQQMENMSILEKESPKKMETPMEELEEYHLQCRGNETRYYDAFKQKQRGNVDFQANLKRLELAGWWDEIIQYKFDEDELPDDFQCRKEWIIWFTQHRPLVEPLDLANYCRLGKKEDSGFYGRPSRYRTCGWKSMMRTSNGKHPRRSLRTGVSGHMLKNLRA